MTVYIDLVFLSNFVIDAALIQATAWTRRVHLKLWRMAAASALGAAYVLVLFMPGAQVLFTFLVKTCVSLMMVWIAFGFGSLQHYVRNLAAFYVVHFAAAGTLFAVHYMLLDSVEVLRSLAFAQSGGLQFTLQVGLALIIFGIPASIWLFRTVVATASQSERISQFQADVEVRVGGRTIRCRGLIDTGNRLYEPLTRTPVMVMQADLWQGLLPSSWLEAVRNGKADSILDEEEPPPGNAGSPCQNQEDEAFRQMLQSRIRFVPYRGIQAGTRFMLAIKPDHVTVVLEDAVPMTTTKALVGLKGEAISSDGTYHAIIHPDMARQADQPASGRAGVVAMQGAGQSKS
ncbi:sigma-E processing peptidase SpoIIGA [Xylanibacillus composti]|uniref:Sporulation sigma-E factor-processing peptidase n=1 Tax=Xylanibacillus composti TaxID=1572762 RepID=A0A8J4H1N7_9BACL|nr:sigma-E processing peptidase SpoIIGA [Xylanibacillus composti]GIQ67951.1 sporulation sigma-E factor-processing peptidase [Xylanibacillus composti]